MKQVNIGSQDVEIVGDRFLLVPHARLNFFPHVGCLFIHIPKTGGTSVSAYLAQVDEFLRLDGVQPKFPLPLHRHNRHSKAVQYQRYLEREIWDNSFKFCVVRNPFDQMVSSYHWWLQKAELFPAHAPGAALVKGLGSFEAYLAHELGSSRINEVPGNPEDWFLDERGEDLVHFVVKSEELASLPHILQQHSRIPRGARVPTLNKSSRGSYRAFYSADAHRATEKRFRYIMERFQYEF